MGVYIKCKCGNDTFEVNKNPYSKETCNKEHYEIICLKCGYGVPLGIIKGFDCSEIGIEHWEEKRKRNELK